MGPYCGFCGNRCFTHIPSLTPQEILDAYGTSSIIATCRGGQEFEKKRVGYCYDDIMLILRTVNAGVPGVQEIRSPVNEMTKPPA